MSDNYYDLYEHYYCPNLELILSLRRKLNVFPQISIGTVIMTPAGTQATVTIDPSSTNANTILNFTLPLGNTGLPGTDGVNGVAGLSPTISIGTVTTGAAGTPTSVTVDSASTASHIILNFVIPQGLIGLTGSAGITPMPNYAGSSTVETSTSAFFPTTVPASNVAVIGTSYTAPSNGWVAISIGVSALNNFAPVFWTVEVNGKAVMTQGINNNVLPDAIAYTLPLQSGDVITLSATSANATTVTYTSFSEMVFIPYM